MNLAWPYGQMDLAQRSQTSRPDFSLSDAWLPQRVAAAATLDTMMLNSRMVPNSTLVKSRTARHCSSFTRSRRKPHAKPVTVVTLRIKHFASENMAKEFVVELAEEYRRGSTKDKIEELKKQKLMGLGVFRKPEKNGKAEVITDGTHSRSAKGSRHEEAKR